MKPRTSAVGDTAAATARPAAGARSEQRRAVSPGAVAGAGAGAKAAAPQSPSQAPAQARPAAADQSAAAMELLMRLEHLARTAGDLTELQHMAANETRKLNRARQIFIVGLPARGRAEVVLASGVTMVDSHASLVRSVSELIVAMARERGLAEDVDFTLPAYCGAGSELATHYPFRELLWLPFLDRRGEPFAGMLLARETPWTTPETVVGRRLAAAYAHAWREIATSRHFRRRISRRSWLAAAAAVIVAGLAVVPVPMTALAPVEIVAAAPFVVAAPLDAVIDEVVIEPSSPVKVGDVLVRFSDTELRNRAEIARREVGVAQSRVKQATILAFEDSKGRHELGLAMAELELKRAELAFAEDVLARTVLRAERDGIAVFTDRKSLTGRPVATGERILEIADPLRVEARIDLAVPDAIALKAESAVKLFLDVDPLRPWAGTVTRSDYRARPTESDVLAYRTFAALSAEERPPPRIGLRGTAQVYGDDVALAVFLFRRPISAMRQWMGI